MGAAFRKLFIKLFDRKLEAVLIGLDGSGKSTLLSVLSDGEPAPTAPTIGLNVKTLKRGKVTLKCWDIGGQAKFRGEWLRYTKGTDAIVFVVDASDFERCVRVAACTFARQCPTHRGRLTRFLVLPRKHVCAGDEAVYVTARMAWFCDVRLRLCGTPTCRRRISESRKELHRLLENPELASTPVLVLANKIDLQPHIVRSSRRAQERRAVRCADAPVL